MSANFVIATDLPQANISVLSTPVDTAVITTGPASFTITEATQTAGPHIAQSIGETLDQAVVATAGIIEKGYTNAAGVVSKLATGAEHTVSDATVRVSAAGYVVGEKATQAAAVISRGAQAATHDLIVGAGTAKRTFDSATKVMSAKAFETELQIQQTADSAMALVGKSADRINLTAQQVKQNAYHAGEVVATKTGEFAHTIQSGAVVVGTKASELGHTLQTGAVVVGTKASELGHTLQTGATVVGTKASELGHTLQSGATVVGRTLQRRGSDAIDTVAEAAEAARLAALRAKDMLVEVGIEVGAKVSAALHVVIDPLTGRAMEVDSEEPLVSAAERAAKRARLASTWEGEGGALPTGTQIPLAATITSTSDTVSYTAVSYSPQTESVVKDVVMITSEPTVANFGFSADKAKLSGSGLTPAPMQLAQGP